MKTVSQRKLNPWQYLAVGFLLTILIGAGLLCLPFATRSGERTTFVGALFTSTSATCVTGLIQYDTNLHWSTFGQVVILCLIQLGGLGFMTFVSIALSAVGKRMGMYETKVLMLSAGEERRSELKRLFRRILFGTLLFEGVGALLLSISFVPDFGWGRGLYYAVFHAVSAFCNAGFDLMGGTFGQGSFVSLTHYATDPIVSVVVPLLILTGGLGFCVWDDLLEKKFRYKKLALHTKVVLWMSAIIVVIPTLLFLLFEWNSPALAQYGFFERLLVAFFSAVTPRTAGFNTVDLNALSPMGYLLTVVLMFVGGSSGSTAGGIKITTVAIIVMGMLSVFRGKEDIHVCKRRVENGLLKQALTVFVAFLFIAFTAIFALLCMENGNPKMQELAAQNLLLKQIVFEVFSALGTVGLTLGCTPLLTTGSKLILIVLMYVGRVGILTIGLSVAKAKSSAQIKRPVENILIG
ncbi:MAG: Trk family potassium uptake protein [Clostridiales bacterium]|nr:Trk family potassium uptake protein [Clostridiales bacterium]